MGRPKGKKNKKSIIKANEKQSENITPENEGAEIKSPEDTGDAGNVVELKFDDVNTDENTVDKTPEENISDTLTQFNTPAEEVAPPSGEQKRTRRSKKDAPVESAPVKIPAKLFIKVHNRLLVGAVQLADRFSKNPIPAEYIDHVGLSKEDMEDEDLILAATECLKAMKIESNPIAAFYMSFGALAVTNYMSLKGFLAQQMKQQNQNVEL